MANVRSIISKSYNRSTSAAGGTPAKPALSLLTGMTMSTPTRAARRDPDQGKGVVEGDRPTDQPQMGNPHGDGVDQNGWPDDPVAKANLQSLEGQ